jgi:hypothetical protein
MQMHIGAATVVVSLSANDTREWARRPDAMWPCSFLSGRRMTAEFEAGGLVGLRVDGGRGDQDCPSDELNAIASDFLRENLPPDHPCWFVVVGQFEKEAT